MARLPYPKPLDEQVSKRMSSNRRRDTTPEQAIRRGLHAAGLRFRVDHAVRADGLVVRPDLVFTRCRIAVFVDGCFWHRCPDHGNVPERNRDYWLPKLERNVARDARVDAALTGAGWTVIRAWEHEVSTDVVANVEATVRHAYHLLAN